MKRQLIFCTDGVFPHAVGGMQRHSVLLLAELAKIGIWEIIVIHPHDKKVFDTSLGFKEISIPFEFSGFYIRKQYEYSKEVYKIIEQYPDAVVYAQGFSVLYGLPKIGHRVIINQHGLEPFQGLTFSDKYKTFPMRMMERYQFKHAAKVISLGGRLTTILRREVPNAHKKIEILPNAVIPGEEPIRNFDKEKLELLFVGRFAANKGINVLMEGIRSLNIEGYTERLHFNIVGKGPLYEQYIKENNFSNVTFHGFADDDQLMKLYRSCDLFVFPTLFEGMPTVVLEAMAGGMPIVVTDTGATAELVNRDNGYLIETNNMRSLKWGIQSFYQLTPEKRLELSLASRRKVLKNITWPIVAKKHIELFEKFLN